MVQHSGRVCVRITARAEGRCCMMMIIIIIIIIFERIANVNETRKFTQTVLQVIMYITIIYNMYFKSKGVTFEDEETIL